jgi:4-hydroxy-3-methylbut-2-enyl diphosphate reductase
VLGLTEDLAAYDVVSAEVEVATVAARPRFGVVAQTTQPIDKVRRIVAALREHFPDSEVRFIDTVCLPTKQRQAAAIELAQHSQVVLVIGGPNSNNTRELSATCRRHCPRVFQVQKPEDIQADWFGAVDTIGITAGTSTPDELIDAVEARVRDLARCPALAAAHS